MSAASLVREQMRKDMLSSLGGDEELDAGGEEIRFGIPAAKELEAERQRAEELNDAKVEQGIDWESMVSGTKRVLSMAVSVAPLLRSVLQSLGCISSRSPRSAPPKAVEILQSADAATVDHT